jgi:putative hydrolase of the HAD superfamily
MNIPSNIKIIAFDADDTLWVNETYYRDTEKAFTRLLLDYLPEEKVSELLLETETANIKLYGYGVKGFVLSMIETALKVSEDQVDKKIISQILALGKKLIHPPMVLLDGVKETLQALNKKGLKLVLATKGDLLDQERKLKNSSLSSCFHHIEIMSNKKEEDYKKLHERLDVSANEFLMVGNSIKSDILPVLALGSYAIHIPYHTTWAHENVTNTAQNHNRFLEIKSILELLEVL